MFHIAKHQKVELLCSLLHRFLGSLFYFIYGHWYIETFLYSFQFAKEKSTLIRFSPPVITELDIRPPSSPGIDVDPPLPSQGNQTDAEGNCHTSKKNMHSAYLLFCAGAAQHL